MDEAVYKRKPRQWQGKIKRVSDKREAIVAIPAIVEPVQIELPVAGVAPKIEHVRVAIRVKPCAAYRLCHHPSNTLGVESNLGSQ